MLPETIGRYRIEKELGRGGMAAVYLAYDPATRRRVALKVLPGSFTSDPKFRARFERESEVIAALEHPFIVPMYDIGEAGGQPFIVMRYMPGGSLALQLEGAAIPLPTAVRIIDRLSSALDYAHKQGIVHRDLKPANVLFDQHGNAQLSDFGIVKIVGATTALTGQGILGTPTYMSPEQAQGKIDIDGRSDIYSLGIILFEMLTRTTPFQADTPVGLAVKHMNEPVPAIRARNPKLPAALEPVIERALAKNRDARYQTASDFARDLAWITGGKPTQPSQRTRPQLGVKPLATEERGDLLRKLFKRRFARGEAGVLGLCWLALFGIEMPILAAFGPVVNWSLNSPLGLAAAGALGGLAGGVGMAVWALGAHRAAWRNAVATVALWLIGWTLTLGGIGALISAPAAGILVWALGLIGGLAALYLALVWQLETPPADERDPKTEKVAAQRGVKMKPTVLSKGRKVPPERTQVPPTIVAFQPEPPRLLLRPKGIKAVARLEGHSGRVRQVAWSPDGVLASASWDNTILLWDVERRKPIQTLNGGSKLESVAFSPDGSLIAAGAWSDSVLLWETANGRQRSQLDRHRQAVYGVAFSPDGLRLASASWDKAIVVWDVASGQPIQTLKGHTDGVDQVAYSPDGQLLASSGADRQVIVWDIDHGNVLHKLNGHRDRVGAVAWSPILPGGDKPVAALASGSYDKLVMVWNGLTGERIRTLKGHRSAVHMVAWSPGGDSLASASQDGTIRVWSAKTEDCLFVLKDHHTEVLCVNWSKDGHHLASGAADGRIIVWEVKR